MWYLPWWKKMPPQILGLVLSFLSSRFVWLFTRFAYMYKVFFVLLSFKKLCWTDFRCSAADINASFHYLNHEQSQSWSKYSGGRQFHTSLRNIVNLSHKRLSTHPPIDSLKTRNQLESFFFGLQYLWEFSLMSSTLTSSSPSNERYCKPQRHRSGHVQWYITRNFPYFPGYVWDNFIDLKVRNHLQALTYP